MPTTTTGIDGDDELPPNVTVVRDGEEIIEIYRPKRPNEDYADRAERDEPLEQDGDHFEFRRGRRPEDRQDDGTTTPPEAPNTRSISLDDFYAHMPSHGYIFVPTRDMWPGGSINARIPPIQVGTDDQGEPVKIKASTWLDQNKPVEQMTWFPGEEMIIRDRIVDEGGWIERPGSTVFNLYRPPNCIPGDPSKAQQWLDHVSMVYPYDADHIVKWLAHRVQKPADKINHALLLGGPPGIGKDTLLHPVSYAVGSWNFAEVTPIQLLGRFNGFIKSVIVRVNEARDLGEVNRYAFYEHTKPIIAAPPEVLRCDEKNIKEYSIPNVCGVIITSNYLTNGCYLPADDRRHYVAWSPIDEGSIVKDYFTDLYRWFDAEGNRHVAAYLRSLDLTGFNAKAPPPKTPAFWSIVDANRSSEQGGIADILEAKWEDEANPPIVIHIDMLAEWSGTHPEVVVWLKDPKNKRIIGAELEKVGYTKVSNPTAKSDGRWRVNSRRVVIYGHRKFSTQQHIEAIRKISGIEADR